MAGSPLAGRRTAARHAGRRRVAALAVLASVAGALALGTAALAQGGLLALAWASLNGGGGVGMTGGGYSLGGAVGGTGWGTAGGGAYELRAGFWGGITVGPILAANAGLTVAEGAAATIPGTRLRVAGTPLAGGGSFTQADVDAGRVAYAHDGSETTSDSFGFGVADGAGGTLGPVTFAIAVTPTNDPPTSVALSGTAVAENSPNGTAIGRLSTLDPDVGDTHTYALADAAGGRFAIVGNELRVLDAAQLDYEAARGHQIAVRSTDAGGLSTIVAIAVQVGDVDEAACAHRPRIAVQVVQVGPGTLRATLAPGTSARLPNNPIASIVLVTDPNATLDIGPGLVVEYPSGLLGGSGTVVVHPTNGALSLPVTVKRRAAGAFKVDLLLHDACGPWSTLVGGGANVP